jgi:ATP-dependent DNA ligase
MSAFRRTATVGLRCVRPYIALMVMLRERSSRRSGGIAACLPRSAKTPPAGPGWLHEIKHDGFRIIAKRDAGGVRLITWAGNDFASRFPFIAMAVTIPC